MEKVINRQHRIADRAFDISFEAATSREFIGLLKMFPKDGALHRSLADWLARKARAATAAETFKKSAALYLDQGKILPAIAAKLLQWGQVRPTPQDVRALYAQIHRCRASRHPVSDFFVGLQYPELATLLSVMKLIQVPSGQAVKKFGTLENNFYFVVSGALLSTRFMPLQPGAGASGKPTNLRENDVFGDIFPIEEEIISPSFVKAVCASELIRIPKGPLAAACRKSPGVIDAMQRIGARADRSGAETESRTRQKSNRQHLAVRLSVYLPVSAAQGPPLILEGHSNNISVGGACVVLVAPQAEKLPPQVTGLETKINVSLPDDSVTVTILGRVAWAHPAIVDGEVCMVLGIQFKKMTPQLIGYLIVFSDILKSMA